MKHIKKFNEGIVLDTLKKDLRDRMKKGGLYFITNSDRFKKLTELKDKQQKKLDLEIGKYGDTMTIGGEAAKIMVDMYNRNLILLDDTIQKYLSNKITKQDVISILDKKIQEVNRTQAGLLLDATQFKKAALDLLNWLKSDVAPWLI
jgi:hypothetical protein